MAIFNEPMNKSNRQYLLFTCILLVIGIFIISCSQKFERKTAINGEWAKYQNDNYNSGVSNESIEFPLVEKWRYIANHKPDPAWPEPAKADLWHEIPKLAPLVTYDRAYHVSVKNDLLYFASSTDHKIYCLDANTGFEVWTFFTDGPNRTSPVISGENLYFGSDDGYVYCLEAETGKFIWKKYISEKNRKIIGNSQIISSCPVRSGLLIRNDSLFGAAGLFPTDEVYVFALNKNDGSVIWKEKQSDLSPQGYPVLKDSLIYIPGSRSRPYVFNVSDGKLVKKLGGVAGDYIAATEKELFHGMNNSGKIDNKDFLSAALSGYKVIEKENIFYITSDFYITALEKEKYEEVIARRKELNDQVSKAGTELKGLRNTVGGGGELIDNKLNEIINIGRRIEQLEGKEFLWRRNINLPYSMIMSNGHLIVGEKNNVKIIDAKTGEIVWENSLTGNPYGLAFACGKLFVSTDEGNIHCFSTKTENEFLVIKNNKDYSPFVSDKLFELTAEKIVEKTKIGKGYCIVLDNNNGKLAYEIATRTDLKIIGVEKNEIKVEKTRTIFDKAGLYGNRIVIFHGELEDLGFTDNIANLILSDKILRNNNINFSPEEIQRLLRPGKGDAIFGHPKGEEKIRISDLKKWKEVAQDPGWKIDNELGIWLHYKKEIPEGSGSWTDLYANPANTACSGDELISDSLIPQWFGGPGPRNMVDRHHRAAAPLVLNGLLIIPGDNYLAGADAYNGTLYWEKTIPGFRRLGAFKDAGIISMRDDYLYVALEGRCQLLNPLDGNVENTLFFLSYILLKTDTGVIFLPQKTHLLEAPESLMLFIIPYQNKWIMNYAGRIIKN